MSDRRFIFGAFALVLVLSSLKHLRKGQAPPLRILFGALIGAVLLAMLSEVNEKLANTFAAFFALSVALTNGGALDSVTTILNRK